MYTHNLIINLYSLTSKINRVETIPKQAVLEKPYE